MVEIGNIAKLEIKDLAKRCVADAEKSSQWPESCKEFTNQFIKNQPDVNRMIHVETNAEPFYLSMMSFVLIQYD